MLDDMHMYMHVCMHMYMHMYINMHMHIAHHDRESLDSSPLGLPKSGRKRGDFRWSNGSFSEVSK